MIATLLVGMLCVYLLSFAVMFLLIGRRLDAGKMGMDAFAVGNFTLGAAYVLQLLEGPAGWSWMGVVNHSLTLGALLAYSVGGLRFFGRPTSLLWPLAALGLGYAVVQIIVEWVWGPVARYVLLAAICALCFAGMVVVLLAGLRTFARDLRGEVLLFAALISGICVLNVLKLTKLLAGGLPALAMDDQFQVVFYVYMCSLATIIPPFIVWLVLRRLTDKLRDMAARDPLTQLLNRRGLTEALAARLRRPNAGARLLLIDVDHFKRVNDRYGHHAGDAVLCAIVDVLRGAVGTDDLLCRMGGEEFAVVCPGADADNALRVAERVRIAVASTVMLQVAGEAVRCTVTVGVSGSFDDDASLVRAMQDADAALYRGKNAGRNRVELGGVTASAAPVGEGAPGAQSAIESQGGSG
ncbi:GGDEF domain-containing protein [Luteimonas sp. 3794]|uniref:GGDEF domain-containing protein n=1 Tax=Luteimonas sp. 3794 TaxID=2817730 RepID=UPI00285E2E42|nr:GGDEF domain-containing protein [Luteimonas sp. 3794]MDR6992905.1 diguanylate cyclase (GGDEF)-like protein [Luteimonas sp. 3794]